VYQGEAYDLGGATDIVIVDAITALSSTSYPDSETLQPSALLPQNATETAQTGTNGLLVDTFSLRYRSNSLRYPEAVAVTKRTSHQKHTLGQCCFLTWQAESEPANLALSIRQLKSSASRLTWTGVSRKDPVRCCNFQTSSNVFLLAPHHNAGASTTL